MVCARLLLTATVVMGADILGADPKTWAPAEDAKPLVLGADPATYAPVAAGSDSNVTSRRGLASAGCNACCMQNDCSLAFSQSQPGVCCGAHRTRGQIGCCPMGASCVPCANIWKSGEYAFALTVQLLGFFGFFLRLFLPVSIRTV